MHMHVSMCLSSSYAWIWELDHKEGRVPNCGIGEDSWESPGLQVDQISLSKGNQSWIFIGKTEVEVEAPILWSSDAKSRLIR